ncbi:MAG TPA: Do family serine endopeptidase [Pseudomonadales bacterium]|nr:Do family serine endopeptidase [Pseudomonadales bacterium]
MQLKRITAAVTAVSLFAAGAASAWEVPSFLKPTPESAPTVLAANDSTAPQGPIPLTTAPNYREIVKQSGPAVVGITTESEVKVAQNGFRRGFGGDDEGPAIGNGGPGPFGNDPFFQFFRQLPIPHGNAPAQHALGSGFIIKSDGLILTNAHVVRDAKRVTVKLADRREFDAKVLGIDTVTDIAVLKIDAKNLPTVRVGNADGLEVGDYVLAIGQPYGFEESASAGIVSAKGRSLPGDSSVPFIQTDVAVNPGNSGGPLFDSGGAVVGINSQIYSNTGGYEGVSFAIPINVALKVQDEIVKNGKVEHARLGVEVQPLSQQLANSFKLDNPTGALVAKVEPGSAAEKAGIQTGDVILKLNGVVLADAGDLSAKIGMARPGEKATLEVWRDGQSHTIVATLGNASDDMVASADDTQGATGDQGKLGLSVRPLTPQERNQAGVTSGLVVEDARGPAADAGIQPGDVVLAVNGSPVNSAAELREQIHKHDKQVALLVQRGDARIFVPVQLG